MRIVLVLGLCSLAAALLCAVGVAMLVGQALGRREQQGAKALSMLILGVGIKLAGGNPAGTFLIAWVKWTAVFALIAWAAGAMG
jgi:hypothetical protein